MATAALPAVNADALGPSASRTAVVAVISVKILSSANTAGWLMAASVRNSLAAQCRQ